VRHYTSCVLMNVIGLTETFTIRRYFMTQGSNLGGTKVPLGYGVSDKEILLLDETGQEVGANQIGEIAVHSKHLALGYWRRPDLTEAAFLRDPRSGDSRLYLTGDLGMVHPDGCLIHMGRKDFQVKIRGNRVEVSEIEAALLKLDSLQAAVVHVHVDDTGGQRLVAYVVRAEGSFPTVTDLRAALALTLPDYMIPSAFVFMAAIPVVPNGRVDRRALPLPGNSRPTLGVPYMAPRIPIEEDLAKIWAEVLSLDKVGIHDNFFDLGGHSLAATRVVSRIIRNFQI
jgi:acyl-coenzyme A synthetase/AMP-(fatty) acid ligase